MSDTDNEECTQRVDAELAGGDGDNDTTWAWLDPLEGAVAGPNKRLGPLAVRADECTIGRGAACDIVWAHDARLSRVHCRLSRTDEATGAPAVTNLSGNPIVVDGQRLQRQQSAPIRSASVVHLLHRASGDLVDLIGFVVRFRGEQPRSDEGSGAVPGNDEGKEASGANNNNNRPANAQEEDERAKADEQRRKAEDKMEESLTCVICHEVFHKCVSLIPCLHNLCAACWTQCKKADPLCPLCREEVADVQRNHQLMSLVESFLQAHPDKKRPQEELDKMDAQSEFTDEQLRRKRKREDDNEWRPRSPPALRFSMFPLVDEFNSEDNDDDEDEEDEAELGNVLRAHLLSSPLPPPLPPAIPALPPLPLPQQAIPISMPFGGIPASGPFGGVPVGVSMGPILSGAPFGDPFAPPRQFPFGGPLGVPRPPAFAFGGPFGGPFCARACLECQRPGPDGHRCAGGTIHIQCSRCTREMPLRQPLGLPPRPQQCTLCRVYFCGPYYGQCNGGGTRDLVHLSDIDVAVMPPNALAGNDFEKDALMEFVDNNNNSLTGVARGVVAQLRLGTLQVTPDLRRFVGSNLAECFLCRPCTQPVAERLLYVYRESVSDQMPEAIRARPNCWYGSQCRTQRHNTNHAARFNHVCAPSNNAP